MKKKTNMKLVLGVSLGLIFGTIVTYQAATLIAASGVDYDNTSANLTIGGNSVTNVQDAIDALHTKFLAKTPVSICKTGYTKGIDYGANYDCIPSSYDITTGYTCERAKWLHKEKCLYTSGTYYCYADGYYAEGAMGTNIITYGKLGTSGADLETGDALDCDVNGNGKIDVDDEGYSLERFYYVSPRWIPGTDTTSFDNDTAVLIYYSNIYNGAISNSGAAYATQADVQAVDASASDYDNWHGPVTAIKHLPKTKANGGTWNALIKENSRAIIACNNANCETASTTTSGGTLPTNFSYAGYAARLLTIPEIKKAGCDTLSSQTSLETIGALKACNFLMERTKYTDSSKTYGPWLENPTASNSNIAWFVNSGTSNVDRVSVNTANYGSRPAIEVSISEILK